MKQVQSFGVLKTNLRKLGQQNGQAVVEYVLLLIVMISMLMAMKGLFTGAERFMQSYMGDYIACLMEYGELPSLGVENADLKNHKGSGGGKTCNDKFAGFTLADGRSPIGSAPGGSGGPSRGGSNSSSKNSSQNAGRGSRSDSSSSDAGESKSNANSSSRSGSRSSENSSSGSSRYANGQIKRSSDGYGTADNGSVGANADKVKIIEDKQGAGLPQYGSNDSEGRSSKIVYQRNRYRAVTGRLQEEVEKQTRAPRTPSSKTVAVDEEGGRMGPRRSVFTPPEIKPAVAAAEEDQGMDFGYFIKWLMIAAMGIAIFLFFGSQIMSFMNSQEK